MNLNEREEIKMGEIKININLDDISRYYENEFYYIFYNNINNINEINKTRLSQYIGKNPNLKKPIYGQLKNTLQNSYIFKNVSSYKNIKSHKNCVLTIPIDWVSMIEIKKFLPKIPLEVILHEIFSYL
jgi:hypothetical protein